MNPKYAKNSQKSTCLNFNQRCTTYAQPTQKVRAHPLHNLCTTSHTLCKSLLFNGNSGIHRLCTFFKLLTEIQKSVKALNINGYMRLSTEIKCSYIESNILNISIKNNDLQRVCTLFGGILKNRCLYKLLKNKHKNNLPTKLLTGAQPTQKTPPKGGYYITSLLGALGYVITHALTGIKNKSKITKSLNYVYS